MATQTKQPAKSSGGDNSVLFIFAYFLSWLSGLIVYFTEGQKDKRMKFHAVQAILLGIAATVVAIILGWIPLIGQIIYLLLFLVWLYSLYVGYRAYTGTDISIPVIGDYAKGASK
jgi:uncharacterized membrane protein